MRRLQYGHDNQPRELQCRFTVRLFICRCPSVIDSVTTSAIMQRGDPFISRTVCTEYTTICRRTQEHLRGRGLEIVAKAQKYWSYFSGEEQSLLNRINAKALRYTPKADAYVSVKAPIFQRIPIVILRPSTTSMHLCNG